MVNDLKEIILLQKPDIIFGSDYDYHEEHHLVTIAIDEALGKVLKSKQRNGSCALTAEPLFTIG